jgi:hypothetical protein
VGRLYQAEEFSQLCSHFQQVISEWLAGKVCPAPTIDDDTDRGLNQSIMNPTAKKGLLTQQDGLIKKQVHPAGRITPHTRRKPRDLKSYHLHCDCGQLAVTVIKVRVGTNPQYVVKLSLCASCLALERSFYE